MARVVWSRAQDDDARDAFKRKEWTRHSSPKILFLKRENLKMFEL